MAEEKLFTSIVEMMEEAYGFLAKREPGATTDAYIAHWLELGQRNIKTMNNHLKTSNLRTSVKQMIQSKISLLQSWIAQFAQRQQPIVGGGIDGADNINNRVKWVDLESAFNSRIRTGAVVNLRHLSLEDFLADAGLLTIKHLRGVQQNEGNVKVNANLSCKFENVKAASVQEEVKSFTTRNEIILPSTDLSIWFNEKIAKTLAKEVEKFQHEGSGWSMQEIINVVININRYQPLAGGLSTFVALPKDIQRKRAVVNVQNDDERCFL